MAHWVTYQIKISQKRLPCFEFHEIYDSVTLCEDEHEKRMHKILALHYTPYNHLANLTIHLYSMLGFL